MIVRGSNIFGVVNAKSNQIGHVNLLIVVNQDQVQVEHNFSRTKDAEITPGLCLKLSGMFLIIHYGHVNAEIWK